jgi:hypothetical protein
VSRNWGSLEAEARTYLNGLKKIEPMTKYLDVLKDARRSDTFGDADHFPLDLPPKVGHEGR